MFQTIADALLLSFGYFWFVVAIFFMGLFVILGIAGLFREFRATIHLARGLDRDPLDDPPSGSRIVWINLSQWALALGTFLYFSISEWPFIEGLEEKVSTILVSMFFAVITYAIVGVTLELIVGRLRRN